jgi:hypothetical protein
MLRENILGRFIADNDPLKTQARADRTTIAIRSNKNDTK